MARRCRKRFEGYHHGWYQCHLVEGHSGSCGPLPGRDPADQPQEEKVNRFQVSFVLEQQPKPGPWRVEWDERDVEAAVQMEFRDETGGVIQQATNISVKRLKERHTNHGKCLALGCNCMRGH